MISARHLYDDLRSLYHVHMLCYLGHGQRRFGIHPMYVHHRANWEFFAVVKGSCALVRQDNQPEALHARRLWLIAPTLAHGWSGRGSQGCTVAVFHFSRVPRMVERMAEHRGVVEIAVSASQCQRIMQLATQLKPHYERMTGRSLLLFEQALLELSLLLPDDGVAAAPAESRMDFAVRKVEAAITWYLENLAHRPTLEEVASSVAISSRHLRRLFLDVKQQPPTAFFRELRLQRALDLLERGEEKQAAIVRTCGFSSASDFCRVFKAHHGISPAAWRQRAAVQGTRTR
ncbi:MAG TPA: AraC family transcriptional regulator [Kiritimatiellia bacterium]|nr:AraC family transcriptional regulator [Kiritimatiellia bacterium]HMP33608.1 AraC family transcriptional regulator [Kiritimatiellia bacterium]